MRNAKFVNEKYKHNQTIGGEGTQVGLMFTTDANCGFRIVFPTHQTNFIIALTQLANITDTAR